MMSVLFFNVHITVFLSSTLEEIIVRRIIRAYIYQPVGRTSQLTLDNRFRISTIPHTLPAPMAISWVTIEHPTTLLNTHALYQVT